MNRKIQITVIGDSEDIEVNNRLAYEVGKFVAQNGWVLINGGNGGIMSAVSKGAFENGGIVVSVTNWSEMDKGHDYATIKIPTGIGWARNSVNILAGDVIIGIGGKSGTLSEYAYAWCYQKPIIALSTTGGWSSKLAGENIDDRYQRPIVGADNLEDFKTKLNEIVKNLNSD